jgi:acetolactate synthase I/II/III large subunit
MTTLDRTTPICQLEDPHPHGPSPMQSMTTAEATVAALLAHGLDTIYALPGLHNDPLFDALFKSANSIRTIHTRHEQGAAYMALGAALATGRPQSYAVVPGPGLLNSGAALLTAYGMNAPVLALIGQIPEADIGRGLGHLHEIRDQAGILARLVYYSTRIRTPDAAPRLVAEAFRAMSSGRRGPAALECAMDTWAATGQIEPHPPFAARTTAIDEDAILDAAKRLGKAKCPMIICGGGAQDAAAEVTQLSAMLQAPVLAYRRGRGVLDSRDPLSITLPLGHKLWSETDAVLAVGTRLFVQYTRWGVDDGLDIIHLDADPVEPMRMRKPAVALIGDAKPILTRLLDVLPAHNGKRASRKEEMKTHQEDLRKQLAKLAPQMAFLKAIRAELPEDGILVDDVTQVGFVSRLAFPVYKPRTFLSSGYQDNLGWGFATALGAQHAKPDVPVISINGDGGFLYAASELATAMRHRIPLVTIVFTDGAFGNVRRIQEERYGNRLIGCDLTNPNFVRFAQSFGAAAERVGAPKDLRAALKRAFRRRDRPSLIEVPVGPLPSPWEFIHMPKVRGN